MKLLDTDNPFFRPLWLRVAIVLITAAWGVFELYLGEVVWSLIFWAFCALSIYGFFIDFDPDRPKDD